MSAGARAAWSSGRSVTAATTVATGLMSKTVVRNQISSELQILPLTPQYSKYMKKLNKIYKVQNKVTKDSVMTVQDLL